MTLLTKHTILMHQTAIPSGVGPVFEADSGERISLTGANHEDMGRPGTIVVDVRPGLIEDYGAPEPEAPDEKRPDSEDKRPLQILRDALGDDTVDHYLNVLGLLNRDQEAKALLSAVDTIKQTGGAVEIAGVRIEPCDTYGQTTTTQELELMRRQVQSLIRARELGPIVVTQDEMPSMDVREHDVVHIDTTNTSFLFFLETDKLTEEQTVDYVAGMVAEIRAETAEPKSDFERTTAIAVRNLEEILANENNEAEVRLQAAKLLLDHLR